MGKLAAMASIAGIGLIVIVSIQGGALNHGLKRFFQYIGLHVILKLILGLKRTVLYGLDPWPTIHSILTSFFLATASRRRRNERHVLRIYTAASRRYSEATDGCRAAKLAWGVAWIFFRPTLPVEKSSESNFGEYGGKSAKNQNSANGR